MRAQLIITDPYEDFEILEGEIETPERFHLTLKNFPSSIYGLLKIFFYLFSKGPFGQSPHPGLLSLLKMEPDWLFKSNDGRYFRLQARHIGSSLKNFLRGEEITVNIFDIERNTMIGIGELRPLSQ